MCIAGLILLFIVFGISSCSKTGADCFTSTGEVTREARHVDDFDTIIANENVDIIITQDTVNSLEVEGNTHLLDPVESGPTTLHRTSEHSDYLFGQLHTQSTDFSIGSPVETVVANQGGPDVSTASLQIHRNLNALEFLQSLHGHSRKL